MAAISIPLNKERFAILVLHFNPLATKTKNTLFLFWSKQTTTEHDFQLAATGADETMPLIFKRKQLLFSEFYGAITTF